MALEEVLEDLRDRSYKASFILDRAAENEPGCLEQARLRGKATGVRLAVSYIEEALREYRQEHGPEAPDRSDTHCDPVGDLRRPESGDLNA